MLLLFKDMFSGQQELPLPLWKHDSFDSILDSIFWQQFPNFWKNLCCRQSFTLNAGSKSEAYMWKTRNRKWPNLSEKISPVKICHFWVNIPYLRIWEIFPWNCAMITARDFKLWSLTWVKLHWLTGRINEVWGKCNTASRITQSYTFFLLNFDWKKTIEAQDRLLKTILGFLLFHMLGNIPIIRAVRKCQIVISGINFFPQLNQSSLSVCGKLKNLTEKCCSLKISNRRNQFQGVCLANERACA